MKKFVYQIVLAVFFFLLVCSKVDAEEKISNFDAKININQDGTIQVEEKIVYDFGDLRKHGIYRTIPLSKINSGNKKFYLKISGVSIVDATGKKYHYSQTNIGDDLSIKIGDANTYVTGTKTYVISYKVSGALTYFSEHDELYWNVVGNAWEIPIASASVDIKLPQIVELSQIKSTCYTGTYGSTSQFCEIEKKETGMNVFVKKELQVKEGFSVVLGFPKGIAAVLEPREAVDFFSTIFGKILLTILGIMAFCWYIIYPIWLPIKWFLHGRDPKTTNMVVTAWYDPPKSKSGRLLTPIETGTLIDEQVDLRDISGMIVDLARRGYFKIVEKKKKDFYFIKGKDPNNKDLMDFEKDFLKAVFTEKEIRLKDVNLVADIEAIKKKVYEQQVADGFFPKNPNSIRNFYLIITGLAAFTFNFQLVFSAMIFGRSMPKRTLFGAEQKNIALSLKNFLQSQERQLAFQAKNQMLFEKLLPYAIIFGVEKIWADRFKDIDLKQPDWYQGYGNQNFNSLLLISSLNSSFSSIKSTISSTNSSSGFSSGFSSGGFSGGGGGGGGGGSW